MTDTTELSQTASTPQVRSRLERALSEHFGETCRVARLERRPSPFATSFTIEELDVLLDDGRSFELVFKDLSDSALAPKARKVRPSFLYDPLREIETYRAILTRTQLGTATYYGATTDGRHERYWLFLENVPGVALWQVGDLPTWEKTARWLAAMHHHFAGDALRPMQTQHLLHYDADFYLLWMQRAQTFVRRSGRRPRSSAIQLEWLASRYRDVVERLIAIPVTFIHGEFYASNVLVNTDSTAQRICPIDWERAAIGPGLVDLAALTAGTWADDDRRALALAYRDALVRLGGSPPAQDEFLRSLDCCSLYLALQWLGWAPDWSPPRKHRQDWLAEALRLAELLEL
jgi:thiamine kinase-like enzyme